MKAIKKISVVPIDTEGGKIINSFDTTDDKTTNAPSIQAVENKKQNKVLSGTSTPSNSLGENGDIYLQYSE